ncbi:OrNVorf138-like [Venturia canescens]|uniref:OrNVorf138-like n=2 Tax=Venturia canescens TaxID=32260 RepID=A0ACB9ZLG6_9HYME|nr:uncharacterized protein LOC122408869 [Venturia canescens]AJZ73152.1 hypothetical protein [Venturia canescens]KAI5630639.1 OrNVorf138-like [Venturia canescens]
MAGLSTDKTDKTTVLLQYEVSHENYLARCIPGTRLHAKIHGSLPVLASSILTHNLDVKRADVFYLSGSSDGSYYCDLPVSPQASKRVGDQTRETLRAQC